MRKPTHTVPQPPNANHYSIDGSMRNYTQGGAERYRRDLIAYLREQGGDTRLAHASRGERMALPEFVSMMGWMLVAQMPPTTTRS